VGDKAAEKRLGGHAAWIEAGAACAGYLVGGAGSFVRVIWADDVDERVTGDLSACIWDSLRISLRGRVAVPVPFGYIAFKSVRIRQQWLPRLCMKRENEDDSKALIRLRDVALLLLLSTLLAGIAALVGKRGT
jgi:hypothetical protein